MRKPIRALTYNEISDKANTIITKLIKAKVLTSYEESILRICLGRLEALEDRVESTQRWANEAFAEQRRLTDLLMERWRAGWRGESEIHSLRNTETQSESKDGQK